VNISQDVFQSPTGSPFHRASDAHRARNGAVREGTVRDTEEQQAREGAERRLEAAGHQLGAAFEQALARLAGAIEKAAGRERSWLSRLRAGLVALLGFFEDEPLRGRLLLCEAPVADRPSDAAMTLRREQRLLGVLAGLLEDAPRRPGVPSCDSPLLSELIAGGVFGAIRARLLEGSNATGAGQAGEGDGRSQGGGERAEGESAEGDGGSLVELAPSLMAFIVAPYLGQAAASEELSGRPSPAEERGAGGRRLYATQRTRLALRAIAAAPRSSNREVARVAGLCDEGQTSRLLRRLAERGLIENVGLGQEGGQANAWLLTSRGARMLGRLGEPAGEERCA
jgi:hypothetical protein